MITLGIETSCDETALALIETRSNTDDHPGTKNADFGVRVIHSLVHSQAELHSAYGGVYPTLAKREHSKNLIPLLEKLLRESAIKTKLTIDQTDFILKKQSLERDYLQQNPDLLQSFANADFLRHVPCIDRIAVTEGPGLEPTLWVGITFARILAGLWDVPVVPVDHMEGHIVGSLLPSDAPYGVWQNLHTVAYPALALLISGGHTELIKIGSPGSYEIIGHTKDDAVGEAFDKVARLLGLPYPGGPHLARLAEESRNEGINSVVPLPRPMITSNDLNFSFSGLKTAVLYAVRKNEINITKESELFKKGLAREFEDAVSDVLSAKVSKAIEEIGAQALIIGGGVSANHSIRQHLTKTALEYGIPIFLPSPHISGDNALMIALAGTLHNGTAKTPGEIRAQGTKRLGSH